MDWRSKVKLFEEIRREYEFGEGTIKGVARKLGVHRQTVRQALESAIPPDRKSRQWEKPKIEPVRDFIESILESDRKAPRKQRHTAHRIYVRIKEEMAECEVAESTVRHYVARRKAELGMKGTEIFIPQSYQWGCEAQVDWYQACAELGGEMQEVEVFSMRSMASGAAFHRAYPRATQQAFFEGHQQAFEYFGGTFHLCRYDNLKAAVKKILRGYTREENARFIAFRSHWKFEAQFCRPGKQGAHEKGGVEGEGGYFRRNHFVPIPKAEDFADLNRQLFSSCQQDQHRQIGERQQSVGAGMLIEQQYLLPLASDGFELTETSFPIVDAKGRVKVRNNWYSVPLRAGIKVMARTLPTYIELWHEGNLVARHERSYKVGHQILNLEHYLEVLTYKPGAFAGSKPLEQWRAAGRWPSSYDKFWEKLQKRFGKQQGTREMIELLLLGKKYSYERLTTAIEKALSLECADPAAVKYLIVEGEISVKTIPAIDVGVLVRYERPLPQVSTYNQLLDMEAAG